MRKLVSFVLALMLVLGVCSFASADAAALEPVTLEWYLAEDSMPDNQTVFDALNKYFQEKINTTINFHFVPISEYSQKVSTILSSGQEVDIVNANSELNYAGWAKKGAFAPIEDLLKEYSPETYALIPEGYWSAMYVDGHIYGVPSYKDSCQMYAMLYNETMANELGMDMSNVVIHNGEDIIPILYEAYEKRNAAHPELASLPITRYCMSIDRWRQYETISGFVVTMVPGVEGFEGKKIGEVFNVYDTEEFRNMCKTTAKMFDDGLLPYDLFNFDSSRIYSRDGSYFLSDIGSGYVTVAKDYNGTAFDTNMVAFADRIASTNYLHNAVECVAASSKNKERAVMVLEMLNTDPYVVTTLRFGIEGEPYNVGEDGILDFTGTKNDASLGTLGHYYWYGAQFGSFVMGAVPAGYPANFFELIEEANNSAITDTNMGFLFDPTPVQNELAACSSVIGEYQTNLVFGYVELEDIDATIDEFIAKMKANGVDKVIAEAQSQLDAWRAANGK